MQEFLDEIEQYWVKTNELYSMTDLLEINRELTIREEQKLKEYTIKDYLLLTGDPAIIGVACSIVSDITNGKYNLLKWDKQERRYYPVEINLYFKG